MMVSPHRMNVNTIMKILSIDQSFTSSGIVLSVDNIMVYSEVFTTPKTDNIFLRASNVATRLLRLAELHSPDIIAIEGLAFGMRGNATRDLAGLQFAIIIELQINNGYQVEIIAPLSVKKFATGSGKASKKEMFAALPENIQCNLLTEKKYLKTKGLYDITDAIWIGNVAFDKNGPII